jgi:hypothetical protein
MEALINVHPPTIAGAFPIWSISLANTGFPTILRNILAHP